MSIALERRDGSMDANAQGAHGPRRVLLVTQASGGGVGRHFFELAEGLADRGIDVVGIYSPRKLDTACRARLAAGGLPPMVAFPMRRAVHPLDAVDVWKLIRLIRRLGPFDLVHGHSSKGGALARLAARWLGIPSIYTPNAFVTLDPELKPWERFFYGQVERRLARHTAAIIAVSSDEAEHARQLGIDADKIHVVHNGIDPPDFPSRSAVRASLGLRPEELVIGFVGRLAAQKAPDVMLRAFAELASQLPRARLVMAGDGPLADATGKLCDQLDISSRVTMLGDVVGTAVMPAFDVFCLPSRYEGMPYVLLEALACGLPIVATRVSGTTTCVDDGENGIVVERDDVEALAAALAQVAADESLRKRYGTASQVKAERFSIRRMLDETLAVYREVVAARGERGSSSSSRAVPTAGSEALLPNA